jgi:PASTA domain
MSLVKTGVSALGKLLTVVILAAAFLVGMVGVVYMSLRGEEVKVPEIVGKDFGESEKELAALGLKLKRRSYRYSEEKPNTVIEQSPKAGDTVKTGLEILVVVSPANPEGTEAPATLKKDSDEVETLDNSGGDKPKTSNKNTGKKPEKTRDVISNKANKNASGANSNNNSADGSSNSKSNSSGGENKNGSTAPSTNKMTPGNPSKTPAAKPTAKPGAGAGAADRRSP